MRVVFAGTPEPAAPSLRRLLDDPDFDVVAVLTRPDAPAGRGRAARRSPVGVLADEAGIPVLTPRRLADVAGELADLAPDAIPVVAYGALVPPSLLDLPAHGWINLHFSLLPAWRGAAPVQAAIAAGDDVTGASTFRIEAGLDTGPVFGTITETIRPADTAGDLLGRLADAGAELLAATLAGVAAGQVGAAPQPAEGVSHAPKIDAAAARIDWTRPAHIVDRRIRAVTPAPGAWTTLGDVRVKVGPVTVDERADLAPGAVAVTKSQVRVGVGGGSVVLGTVQPPGKRPMAAGDWARGARPAGTTVFE